MAEFVGEPIDVAEGTFATGAMGRGEPGLPGGFVRRGVGYRIAELLGQWKGTAPTPSRGGEFIIQPFSGVTSHAPLIELLAQHGHQDHVEQ